MSVETETQSQPTTPDAGPKTIEQEAQEWADAPNDVDEQPEVKAKATQEQGEDGPPPLDPNEPEAEVQSAEVEAEPNPDDEPPEFWSAERKELWAKIQDPEIRAAIKGHVEDASKAISSKMEEAAAARKAAEEAAAAEHRNRDQLAGWWKQNGPMIAQLIQGKYAGIDWNKLAADNPAEYVRLKASADADVAKFREMNERHQAEIKASEQRQKQAHDNERAAEHAKLVKEFPKEFGEKAQETYDNLSKYLLTQGIPAERLPNIYEASVVKIARKAYMYDQLQAKAKTVTSQKPPAQSATTTPTRVTPGAAKASANPESEAKRQAIHALKSGKNLSREEAGLAFG